MTDEESRSSETMNRKALVVTRAVNRMSVMKVKDNARGNWIKGHQQRRHERDKDFFVVQPN